MMIKNRYQGKALAASLLLACIGFFGTSAHAASKASANTTCAADSTWFSNPSMPTEVKKSESGGTASSFCDFYQFAWQAFAYLMATPASGGASRNFLDPSQFYELEVKSDGSPANSCDGSATGKKVFVRTVKNKDGGTEIIIPERINQAGDSATIYDQNENVVYYDVRFSKNLCDVAAIQSNFNFPGGTVELKATWKVLASIDNADDFITIDAPGASACLPSLIHQHQR